MPCISRVSMDLFYAHSEVPGHPFQVESAPAFAPSQEHSNSEKHLQCAVVGAL